MIASLDPTDGAATWTDDSLARTLRLDLEDEERRALLGSYAVSTALGVAFLLLQQFGPRSERVLSLLPDDKQVIVVQDLTGIPEPTIIPDGSPRTARAGAGRDAGMRETSAGAASAEDAISGAFGAPAGGHGAMVGDPKGLLRGVSLSTGDAPSGGETKRVLGYGEGGAGSSLPGGAGLGGGSAAGIGGVRGTTGVGRAQVAVSGLEVRPLDDRRPGGGATAALGTFVRGHESELRFCYEESLKSDPALAGSVAVAITIAESGHIAGAEVARRSWTGKGAAEAEACMLRTIRGWRLSGVERSAGTYTFPFSFTR